jgi:cell cycle checkpoint control protein RAD9A
LVPGDPDTVNASRLTVGPRAIKDMLDHFPVAKGGKSDPQLIWNFGDSEVQVKSMETSIDTKGKTCFFPPFCFT